MSQQKIEAHTLTETLPIKCETHIASYGHISAEDDAIAKGLKNYYWFIAYIR